MSRPAFVVVVAAGVLAPAAARADASLSASPFVTLDRQAGDSSVSLEATYPQLTYFGDEPTFLHFDLHAHYVDPGSRVGAYVDLPVNFLSQSETNIPNGSVMPGSTTALGDVEVGAIYAVGTSVPEVGVILHAGALLPTTSKANMADNLAVELLARPRDVLSALPGFTARLGASPVIHWGTLFARADVDLDINLSNSNGDTAKPILTLAAAAGVAVSSVVLSGEISYVHSFNSLEDLDALTYGIPGISTAAVSARFVAGTVQPYVAVAIPLGYYEATESVALIVGVSARLR